MKNRITLLVIAVLSVVSTINAQSAFTDCSSSPLVLCVNDPGISLPDSNQFLIGEDTPGATSCGVHVTQSRTITSNCIGSIEYYVALVVNSSVQEILQPLKTVYVDFSNQATLRFDTRTASSAAIRKNGLLYNEGCNEYQHRIRWVAIDKCGNEVICEERLQLYDCQAPIISIQIEPVIVILPLSGLIISNAAHFSREINDDCISENGFLYSFERQQYRPDTVIPCDRVPVFGIELPIVIWVADRGTDNNCSGEIEWAERNVYEVPTTFYYTDHFGACDPVFGETISGHVTTINNKSISNAAINLTAPGKVFPTFMTTQNGKFHFSNVIFPDEYTIKASRNDNHRNGVSTLDVIRIHKHLLGIQTLDNPYQIIAADINNSHNVSNIDIVELWKLIQGIYTELPASTGIKSWKFISANHVFPDQMYPWPIDEYIDITSISDSTNFIGIKIGDVNNSVKGVEIESPFQHAYPIISFNTDQRRYIRGEEFDFPIRVIHDGSVLGFQYTMSSSDLHFTDVSIATLPVDMFNGQPVIIENKMTVSWHSISPIVFNGNEILFTIRARALRDGNLGASLSINSTITEAEAYDEHENIYKPVLHVKGGGRQMMLLAPTPNPWNQQTTIPFHLDSATDVILSITDVNSNLLWQKSISGHAGRNEITVYADELLGAGVLFCTMQAGGEVQYQKMMLVK